MTEPVITHFQGIGQWHAQAKRIEAEDAAAEAAAEALAQQRTVEAQNNPPAE